METEDKKSKNICQVSIEFSKKINETTPNSKSLSILKILNQEKNEDNIEQKKIESISDNKILTDYHYEILIHELKKPILKITDLKNDSQSDISKTQSQNTNCKQKRSIKLISLILKLYIKVQQYAKLNHLGNEFIKVLAHFGTYEHFEKGSAIYKLHSKSNYFYFVIRGSVSIKTIDPEKIKEEMNLRENEYKIMSKEIESDEKLQEFFDNYNYENSDNISLQNLIIESGNDNDKIFDATDFEINNNFSEMEKQKKNRNISYMNLQPKRKITILERLRIKLDSTMNEKDDAVLKRKNMKSQIFNKNLVELQKNLGCEIQIIQKGKFFGEWDLILNRPHINCAFANEDTDLLLLDKNYFDKYLEKHLSKADLDRKYFIINRIPLLKIEHLLHMHPEFFDKNAIVYTQYDIADEFFIILQGSGALKKLNISKCKQDIFYNKNEMETMCIIDSGGIVGLEAGREKFGKYEYNFIINEENTVLYRIPLSKNKSNFSPNFRDDLKEFLMSLYVKQYKIIEKRKKDIENYKKMKKMRKSEENKKREKNMSSNIKNEHSNSINKIKCKNIINLKTQVFNFFSDKDIKNQYFQNSKMSKIKLLREYYCHPDKKIKIKKKNKIFLTNIKKREKNILEKNRNSFNNDYYNAKNIFFITPLKTAKNSNKYMKMENKTQMDSSNLIRKKEEKKPLTSPKTQNYYRLTGSARNFTRMNLDKKNKLFFSDLSKITSSTGNNSNINLKNNFIINNKYVTNRASFYLVNKLKRKNIENETQIIPSSTGNSDDNKIIYSTGNFNISESRSKTAGRDQ